MGLTMPALLVALAAPFLPLIATLWFIPAVTAGVSFLATWIFGGDLQMALIAAVTLGAAALVFRMFGLKAALGVLVTGALLLARRSGEKSGVAKRDAAVAKETDRLIRKGQDAAREADTRNADPRNLDEDDGWRRRD